MDDSLRVEDKLYQAQPTPEVIKQAIAAGLIAGEKPLELSLLHNVSLPTISRIKRKYLSAEMLAKMEEEKAAILGDLMIMSLESGIEATVRIANLTKDDGWLCTQNAGDLGKMYGIVSDRVIRVAEALETIKRPIEDHTGYEDKSN